MIHPDTALQPVDPRIGYGVVATRHIPVGTITWVRDSLDHSLSFDEVKRLPKLLRPDFDKYAYIDGDRFVLCWDIGRFVNHSCRPTCMAPGFDFEIAIRDIEPGEQLTGDYATYNLDDGFTCHCGEQDCRGQVKPNDRFRFVELWDDLVLQAFARLKQVEQPLWPLVPNRAEVEQAVADQSRVPSCRTHFIEAGSFSW
jgi:uncharacterized protein